MTMPVNNFPLFATVLSFVGLVGILYAAFIHWGGTENQHGFKRWQVFTIGEGLLEAADLDSNGQISESEFVTLYREGSEPQRGK